VIAGIGVASPVLNHPGDVLRPAAPAPGFDPAALLGRGYRYSDRTTQLAILATTTALADADLLDGGDLAGPGGCFAVVASSNLGNLDTVCRTASVLAAGTAADTSPMDLPNASSNIVASSIAVRFGLRGPNVMVCNGASSGLDAIHLAAVLIRSGRACRVAVVAAETANEVVAQLLGRPVGELFDGAGAVILEPATAAVSRGVRPHAHLAGYVRHAELGASVAGALSDHPPPGLWLTPPWRWPTSPPPAVGDVPRLDIEAALGAASGALGVLQAVAAGHQLGSGGVDPAVLATAGTAGDGIASLLLTRCGVAA
jgi:3-oxoacyl-[acyl-carrier-protein] synthase II